MIDLFKIGAAYIRVSDERQDEYSPDSQLKKIREYAGREGYQIPDEYIYYDDGIIGNQNRNNVVSVGNVGQSDLGEIEKEILNICKKLDIKRKNALLTRAYELLDENK